MPLVAGGAVVFDGLRMSRRDPNRLALSIAVTSAGGALFGGGLIKAAVALLP